MATAIKLAISKATIQDLACLMCSCSSLVPEPADWTFADDRKLPRLVSEGVTLRVLPALCGDSNWSFEMVVSWFPWQAAELFTLHMML
jgi:hypothetical protein